MTDHGMRTTPPDPSRAPTGTMRDDTNEPLRRVQRSANPAKAEGNPAAALRVCGENLRAALAENARLRRELRGTNVSPWVYLPHYTMDTVWQVSR